MSEYGQSRPGFSESSGGFETGGFPQPSSQGGNDYGRQQSYQQPPQNPNGGYSNNNPVNSGSSVPASNGGYGGGQSNYSGGNSGGGSSGYSGGGGGGWKGGNRQNGGGGGWKGGGGGARGGFNKPPLTPEELANLKMPKAAVLAGNYGAPEALIPVIREIADLLKQHGFDIRASAMDGFDKLVLDNVQGLEMHLPWKDFNQVQNAFSTFNSDECKEYAKRYLPEWGTIKESHQAFFCKNARLVLGKSLKHPCQIAIIWSDDGVESPNNRGQRSAHAGHIAALAKAMHIPVINISNPNAVQRLQQFLKGQ